MWARCGVTPWCWVVLNDRRRSACLYRSRYRLADRCHSTARGLPVPDYSSVVPHDLPVFEPAMPDKSSVMVPLLMLFVGVLLFDWRGPRRLSRLDAQAPHK